MTKAGDQQYNVGVINPYALAEVVAGRPIPWKRVPDKRKVLEDVLQTPYEELFDPKFHGPLFLGLKLGKEGRVERTKPEVPEAKLAEMANDLDQGPDPEAAQVRILSDLERFYTGEDLKSVRVARAEINSMGRMSLVLSEPRDRRDQRMARVLRPDVVGTAYGPTEAGNSQPFNPPNSSWGDAGRFFNEAAEFFDPIQGAVANCYLIAAMASVAWAMPYRITHLTRATGTGQDQFTNMIRFYDVDRGNAMREVEVTDRVPLANGSNGFLYCRSSETGEIWPAVYEKAFAKWKTGHAGDQPNIPATAWGDCVRASAELTGLQRHYYWTANESAAELWNKVRANSLGGRTFNPMTAATYGSGDAAPKKVVYSDANLVASHCYSVLGWDYRNGRRYVILRNPWGSTEATSGSLAGGTAVWDVSWWRPINYADPDGVFALDAETFKAYFALLGVVK